MSNSRACLLCSLALLMATADAAAAGQVDEAYAGTHKGTVYKATPQPDVAPAAGTPAPAAAVGGGGSANAVAPAVSGADGGSAPVEPGAGVEIISGGGGGEAGTAKVGHLPVLQ